MPGATLTPGNPCCARDASGARTGVRRYGDGGSDNRFTGDCRRVARPGLDHRTCSPTATVVVTETAPASADPTLESPAIMPDVVCQNLQDAQDEIQRTGVFFSRTDEASGQGRAQLIDRNAVVVAQTPAPGSPVGEAEAILSAVKVGEPSSC